MLSHRTLYGIMEALPLGLGETIFDPGFHVFSMPLIMQRLGRHALDSLKILNAHMCTIADVYNNEFGDIGTIPVEEGSCPIFTRFPIMAGPASMPYELRRLGVRRMYPRALSDEPSIRNFFTNERVMTRGASMIAERLITLPTHMGINPVSAEAIACEIKAVYGAYI